MQLFDGFKKIFFINLLFAAFAILPLYSEIYSLSLNMPQDKTRSVSFPVEFEEEWLTDKSAYDYNHKLARAACFFADAAYSDVDLNAKSDSDIMKNFLALGFERNKIELHYKVNYSASLWGNDQVAFSLAMKDVKTSRGKQKIVVVVVRGTPLNSNEWLSNLNIDDSHKSEEAVHKGFAIASSLVYSSLKTFMLKNNEDFSNASILITGHSRGAAVSNLLAEEIYRDGLCPPERIFAYTFASPNTTTNPTAEDEKYGFIYNIVNAEDIVPTVPLHRDSWHFRKFGITKALVNYTNMDQDEFNNVVLPKVDELYKKFINRGYAPFRTGPFIPAFVTVVLQYFSKDVEKFYKTNGLHKKGSILMEKLFPDENGKKKKEKKESKFWKNVSRFFNKKTSGLLDYIELAFNDMHACEVYYSFMAALDEKDAFSDLGYTTLVVHGSQEFALFNENGKPLCRVSEGLFNYKYMKLPVVGSSAFKENVIVGFPSNMNFKVMIEDETLIASPSRVHLEHYNSAGVYQYSTEVQKIYTRAFRTAVFDVGKKTYKAPGVEVENWNYKQSKKMVADGKLNTGKEFEFTPEVFFSSDLTLSLEFLAGIPYFYGVAGFGYSYDASYIHDAVYGYKIVTGVGTTIPVWRMFDLDINVLPKFCFPENEGRGDFVYMTELRAMVSARVLGTMRVCLGTNIDLDHAINEIHPSIFAGVRF